MIKGAEKDDEDEGTPTPPQSRLCRKPNGITEESPTSWYRHDSKKETRDDPLCFVCEDRHVSNRCHKCGCNLCDSCSKLHMAECKVNPNCGLVGKNSFIPLQNKAANELADDRSPETELENLTKGRTRLEIESQPTEPEIRKRHIKDGIALEACMTGLTNSRSTILTETRDPALFRPSLATSLDIWKGKGGRCGTEIMNEMEDDCPEENFHRADTPYSSQSEMIDKKSAAHLDAQMNCTKSEFTNEQSNMSPDHSQNNSVKGSTRKKRLRENSTDFADGAGMPDKSAVCDKMALGIKYLAGKFSDKCQQLDRDLVALKTEQETIKQTVHKFEGSVVQLEANVKTHVKTAEEQTEKIRANAEKLEAQVEKLNRNDEKFEAIEKRIANAENLKEKVGKLEAQVKTLMENGKIHERNNQELKAKVVKLEDRVQKLEDNDDKLKKDVGQLQEEIQMLKEHDVEQNKHLGKLTASAEKDIKCINRVLEKERTAVAELEVKIRKITVRVAFHSNLGETVTTRQQQTLICDNIVSNVGGGYSSKTGIFTAPMSGVYCFMTTSSPFQDDTSKKAMLNIILEEKAIAYLSASGKGKCTAHTSVPVKAGQKVWLRSFGDREYTFCGGSTSFTGMLVQAES